MQLTGIHHLTAVTANAPGNRDFYTDTLGHAAGQEDGQPGRRLGLPPVLRRRPRHARDGHHVLRLARRPRAARDAAASSAPACASPSGQPRLLGRPAARPRACTHAGRRRARRPADARLRGPRRPAAQPRRRRRARPPRTRGTGAPCRPSTRSAGSGRSRSACRTSKPTDAGADAADEHAPRARVHGRRERRQRRDRRRCTCTRWARAAPPPSCTSRSSRTCAGAGTARAACTTWRSACPTFEEYDQWNERLREFRVPSSGPVDRFYFRSLYFREPNGILFELATDGPGFAADEPMETLGERLAIRGGLRPARLHRLRGIPACGAAGRVRPCAPWRARSCSTRLP